MKKLHTFVEQNKREGAYAAAAGEGTDDRQFYELMSQYKQLRHDDPDEAAKVMELIDQLMDVSEDAQEAAMYL